MQRNGTRRSKRGAEHRAICIESRLEGGEVNKGVAEAGAHVAVSLEAGDNHTPWKQGPQDSFAGID